MTVTVLGIGYGADVTTSTAAALAEADVLIGHEVFLNSVRHLAGPDAECFDVLDRATPEEDVFAVRTRVAAERSAAGAKVVIVSGGDPGLLGMAGPALHHLNRTGDRALPDVRVLPGLSAWQYASAELGAPFNGGVAVLSLCLYSHSDEKVARQIRGAALSGLGTVVYMLRHNGEQHPELFPTERPAAEISRRRFTLLRDTYLAERPADTPTYLLDGLGRAEGHTRIGAPLADALDLYEKSGPESVWCLPGEEYEQGAGLIWGTT
ncbi:SAM-dependent methyltransferase [Streptomyces humi]|uniref:SAM-dependent methyltransferase n=1 Tax=Streptomyces humi TaxID=1428620 RepID=UPI00062878D5|nr:SAM-dependent methyltransferase [Streptomyces humi]